MQSGAFRVLLRGGSVYSSALPTRSSSTEAAAATAMLTVGDRVAWVGTDEDASKFRDRADVVVELDGRLVAPGFVDAHVHLAKTGFALQTLDLSSTTSVADALDRLAGAAVGNDDAVLFAHGWDESRWPEARPFTGAELERAVGNRVAYASRVDAHSAVVSSALVARDSTIRSLDGWHGDGVVERDAHHAARAAVDALWSPAGRAAALLLALRAAASTGLTSVHEANAPHIAPYDDIDVVAELGRERSLPHVVGYWGALLGGDQASSAVSGFAGDLCVDGALGSHTAALDAPYSDAESDGYLYLDDVLVRDHVIWCTERGVQAGFHVIGDRAIRAAASGLVQAADKLGADRVRAARPRLEHVEMPGQAAIATFRDLGVVASVQPAFDAAWGGPHGLYARRLGAERAGAMNPFASMHRAGITLAFGSDSPVTPLDPWGAVRAAVLHSNSSERLSTRQAFLAHTRGGHRACRNDDAGELVPGADASYVIWDVQAAKDTPPGELPGIALAEELPVCVRTVVSGAIAFDAESPT